MMLLYGIILLLVARCGSAQVSLVNSRIANCEKVTIPSKYVTTYVGWPFEVLCNWFAHGEEYKLYELHDADQNTLEEDDLVCEIWNENGSLLFNASSTFSNLIESQPIGLSLDDLEQNSPLQFTITLQAPRISKCLFIQVSLNLVPFEQISCQDFIRNQRKPTYHDVTKDPKNFDCRETAGTFPKTPSHQEGRYKWERNCSSLPADATKNHKNELVIPQLTFDQAGFYTCSVTYKGMTRYIVTKPICVTHRRSVNNPILTCSNPEIRRNQGKDVTFSCTGNLGKGEIDKSFFHFSLEKILPNGTSTSLMACLEARKAKKSRANCQYTFQKNPCYLSIATEEQRKNADALIPFTFTIQNITSDDYGIYFLKLSIILDGSSGANATLVLMPNLIPGLMATATIAGVGVGVVCFLLLFMGVIGYNLVVLRVYLKRYYGQYMPDDKKYGAFLCYNFSQDIDTFAQEDVRRAMWMVRHSLERLGYKVYDERKEGFSQESRAENIRLSIERSHRVVILLSLEFIKDGWSMLALQAGFDEMIKSGSKLIFILLPGIKEYIKQHQKEDETCLMIQTAIKLNYAIPWSNKRRFNKRRFKLKIEDAMPKLKSQKMPRTISTSSNGDVSLHDYVGFDPHNFQRCFSNETDVTDIDVPRSHCDVLMSIDEQQADPSNTVV